MFGVYYFAGAAQGSVALLVVIVLFLQRKGLLEGTVTVEHRHDLGKLLFAFTVFYAYIAFSQYFLIWYANMPEETIFFARRWEGGWTPWSLVLVAAAFVLPFLTLLGRDAKRTRGSLLAGALLVLFARFIDQYWLVLPTVDHEGPHFAWTDLTALLGVGGLFVGVYVLNLARHALLPVGDPYLAHSVRHENV
jgi:hypothetical protein